MIPRDAITSQTPASQNINHHSIPESYNGTEVQVLAFNVGVYDLFALFGFFVISEFWEL